MAYTKSFSDVKFVSNSKTSFDANCHFAAKVLPQNFKISENDSSERYSNIIIPQLRILSKSIKSVYWGGPMGFSEDMGDDKHLLEYKLITSIYKNDTLIYMDNRTHWTEVFSERGEQLHYQVPQEVIDTLVTLSLEEYFKRVKK
ncbi:MAG: hypothetical protein KF725_15805 [Cyclobacteriaceae bacterium]|nr:hypothetical protein [Cyclobacteriaceae bacterium]UYN87802.1 MAG: hypothetical protein KIT51_05985 [Cyclobacteriaceae bacterium]